jgi:inward rectifier potassium channel
MAGLDLRHKGLKVFGISDLYYRTLKASWASFFLSASIVYLLLNFVFALIYYFTPATILNVNGESLWELFIFSFQTSSTIGYGFFLPQSNMAHSIVIFDALIGIFYVAIITGLAFAKFSRPHAKIHFTNQAILTQFDGKPSLMFRLANSRDSQIVDARINVSALVPYTSQEGLELRRFQELKLISNFNPAFVLSWTVIHQIDERSPLYGYDLAKIKEQGVMLIISFTGIDEVMSQTTHANHRYYSDLIIHGKKFVDILKADGDRKYTLDFDKFHDVEKA